MSDPVQWYWEGDKQAVSVSWLVQDFFAEKSVGLIVGESQAGKTFLALDLAVSVATGRQFFGKRVSKGGVLYMLPKVK
jgi:RecA-family ATPase